MGLSEVVVTGILALFGGAGASLIAGWLAKPKTKAEAQQLQAAGEVALSGEAREWARQFAGRTSHAEERAERAEGRVDELEAALIECYGYVRQLRDHYRERGETPPPLPVRLEALWRATGH